MDQSPTDRAVARETLYFALGLAALYAFIVWLSEGGILFTRPLWVDEVWTVLVSGQGSPADVIAALAHGADGGTGFVHLGVWALQGIVGVPSPVLLRTLSLLSVFATLCLVFSVLRRCFSRDASVVGAMAVGAHALVVTHAFEARFYGPWLLCCALFASAIGRHQATLTRRSATMVAVSAVLLSWVHFYGVITLGLMAAGVVASHGRRWRDGLRVVLPAAAGLVAFLALVPMAISMRNALAVPTWVPDFELRQLRTLLRQFWLARVPLIFAGALAVGIVIGWRRNSTRSTSSIARNAMLDAGIVALGSLALLPVALAAVSLLGQASMLQRYNIATVLAWAPLAALAIELLGRWPAHIARVVLAAFWFKAFVDVRFEKLVFTGDVEEAEAAVRVARTQNAPIVFQSVHTWYPVWARDRSNTASLGFLEMSDSTLGRMMRPGTVNERYNLGLVLDRGIVRAHSTRFGVPKLVPQASLDTTPRFVLVAAAAHLPIGFRSIERFSRTVFPHHRVTQLDYNSALLERTPTPHPNSPNDPNRASSSRAGRSR